MTGRAMWKLLAVVVAAALVVACGGSPTAPSPQTSETSPSQPAGGGVCTVGAVTHLTGDAAVYGQSMKKGVELALDKINAQGEKIRVIFEDDRLSAADAQTAFLKLAGSDKVPVILGSCSSTITLSLCPKADEQKVVLISPVSTAPALKECGDYVFSAMATDDAQGPEWVNVADYLKANEVAVMYLNNDYGIGVKDAFLEAYPGKVLIVQPFELGAKDFRTELLKVKATNPKIVFIVDHVAEGSIVIKQAAELGMDVQWVTDVSMVAQETIDLAGGAAEGVMGLRAGSTQTPQYQEFQGAFQAKYNEPPTIWADFAYDTMMLVSLAIDKYGCNSEGIKQGLMEVSQDYVGASGPKAFNEYGISKAVYEWMIVKDGQWVVFQK